MAFLMIKAMTFLALNKLISRSYIKATKINTNDMVLESKIINNTTDVILADDTMKIHYFLR